MSNVVEFRPLAEQPSLDAVMAAYPRQEGVFYLSRAYNSGMVTVPLSELLMAFQRYAAYCRKMNTEPQYIKTMRTYLELHCWNDKYEVERPPILTPTDNKRLRYEQLRASAAKGNRFSADILKRDYGE